HVENAHLRGETIHQGAVFARDQGDDQAGFSRKRNAHHVSEAKSLPLFAVRPPPESTIGEHSIHIECDGSALFHAVARPTRRSFLMTGCSRSKTRFTPSPIDCSTSRMSRTIREIPFGSSDAA